MSLPQGAVNRRRALACLLASLGLLLGAVVAVAPPPAYAAALPCDGHTPQPSGGKAPASDHFPGYERGAGDRGKAITPDEAVARAMDWIDQRLIYCQSYNWPDRHGTSYRTDCSGSISMAWHADNSYTTMSISQISEPIPWSDIQPGDGVLRDGHVEMVTHVEGPDDSDEVRLFSFGSTPSEEVSHTRDGVKAAYDVAIRYDQMQVITPELVRETIEADLRDRVDSTQPRIDPAGQTLVNFETVFSTDADPYRETIELAGGIPVDLAADPTLFEWTFDDGGTDETTHPGLPWSAQNEAERADELIRYPYAETGDYEPFVDITWSNYRYRLPGEDWQPVDGELTLTSPPGSVTVLELESVLTGDEDD